MLNAVIQWITLFIFMSIICMYIAIMYVLFSTEDVILNTG